MDRLLSALERRTERYLTRRKQIKAYNKSKKRTLLGEIWSWIDALIFAVFWVIIINQYLFQFFLIPSPSMVSTLNVGDRVAVIKNAYGTELYPAGPKVGTANRRVERDDIITFYNPEYDSKGPVFDILSQVVFMGTLSLVNIDKNPDGTVAERLYVKRAAALPGDVVKFENGNVLIRVNGENEFVAEDEFREQNNLSKGPHRSVNMDDYVWLKAYGNLLAYDEKGMLNSAPNYLKRSYSLLDQSSNLNDFYEIEHQKALASTKISPYDMAERSSLNSYINGIYVPSEHVLPLGDNRDNSRDGRYFGPVSEADINGKVVLRFWPLSDFSSLSDK